MRGSVTFVWASRRECIERRYSFGRVCSGKLQRQFDHCRKQGACVNIVFIAGLHAEYVVHRAIENGANALAEGFLFGVAALLILGETWRSSRSQTKRREGVDDKIEELQQQVESLTQRVDALATASEERWSDEQQRCVGNICCSRIKDL